MLKQNENGEWVLTIGRHRGKLLSVVVEHYSHWLISWAITASESAEDIAEVDKALKAREREREAELRRE